MGVGPRLSSLSALSPPPRPPLLRTAPLVLSGHLHHSLLYCGSVLRYIFCVFCEWRSPERATPWSSVDVSNPTFCLDRFSKKACNPHSAMEYGICWFTGTRAFQSLLL